MTFKNSILAESTAVLITKTNQIMLLGKWTLLIGPIRKSWYLL